jgi:hypothetical protein
MNRETFGKGIRFVAVLTVFTSTSPRLWSKAPRGSVGLTISVYNEAAVPEAVLSRGEVEASGVFRQAGIEVKWLNCRVPAPDEEGSPACREAIFPEHLQLRIVRKPVGMKGETMGIAFEEEGANGCYADLFYEPMEKFHKSDGTDIANLLGHVAAHEIGHLLLGTNSHSVAGIMHARWTAQDLADVNVGRLVFLDKEARKIQEVLLAGRQPSKEGSLTVAARTGD